MIFGALIWHMACLLAFGGLGGLMSCFLGVGDHGDDGMEMMHECVDMRQLIRRSRGAGCDTAEQSKKVALDYTVGQTHGDATCWCTVQYSTVQYTDGIHRLRTRRYIHPQTTHHTLQHCAFNRDAGICTQPAQPYLPSPRCPLEVWLLLDDATRAALSLT